MSTTPSERGEAALILPDSTVHRLDGDRSIGRGPDSDITLQAASVSRTHARIARLGRTGDRWSIEDRGSRNGTWLNGVRLRPGVPQPLRHGDRISVSVEALVFWQSKPLDPEDTTPPDAPETVSERPLSPFQQQVVRALCGRWQAGGGLDDLPTNDWIAAQLGTPEAGETVKAALRRVYAKAGLTEGSPYAKRRALCRVARQRGWLG